MPKDARGDLQGSCGQIEDSFTHCDTQVRARVALVVTLGYQIHHSGTAEFWPSVKGQIIGPFYGFPIVEYFESLSVYCMS